MMSRRSQQQLLQTLICLYICTACVGAVYQCNGKRWWWLSDQRVKVRNPKWGRTHASVYFDEVFWSGSWDMVRWKELRDSHASTRGGWVNVFTNTRGYKVINNSHYTIKKSEAGNFKLNKRTVNGRLKLGFNVIKNGDVHYEYRARLGGVCKTGKK